MMSALSSTATTAATSMNNSTNNSTTMKYSIQSKTHYAIHQDDDKNKQNYDNGLVVVIVVGRTCNKAYEIPFSLWEHLQVYASRVDEEKEEVGYNVILHTEPYYFNWLIHYSIHSSLPSVLLEDTMEAYEVLSMAVEFGLDDLMQYLDEELTHVHQGRGGRSTAIDTDIIMSDQQENE